MRNTPTPQAESYRAVITSGEILHLFGTGAGGCERLITWLEMDEEHGDELDELMDTLPNPGALAIIQAMQARSRSLQNMINLVTQIKASR